MKYLIAPLIAAALFVAGCGNGDQSPATGGFRPATDQPVATDGADFESRLQAADTIADPLTRDRALQDLAFAVAEAGDVSAVKKVLELMGTEDGFSKDQTTSGAATRLATAGKGEAAVEIAGKITMKSARDKTLEMIPKLSKK